MLYDKHLTPWQRLLRLYILIISPIVLKYCFTMAVELFSVFLEQIQVIDMPKSAALVGIALNAGSETLMVS